MFPVPILDDNNPRQPPRPVGFKLLMIGVAVMFAFVIALLFAPEVDAALIVTIIPAVALVMIAAGVLALMNARSQPQKAKRGLAGLDMYSVIDRLVADLDDDEAAYLRRRLDERDEKAKDELTLSLDEVLEQRAQERDSR